MTLKMESYIGVSDWALSEHITDADLLKRRKNALGLSFVRQ
jgi:hypothetical protein